MLIDIPTPDELRAQRIDKVCRYLLEELRRSGEKMMVSRSQLTICAQAQYIDRDDLDLVCEVFKEHRWKAVVTEHPGSEISLASTTLTIKEP